VFVKARVKPLYEEFKKSYSFLIGYNPVCELELKGIPLNLSMKK
jgi:hypothetical protein